MRDQKFIDRSEYEISISNNLESIQGEIKRGTAPYFTEYIRRTLETLDEELEINIYRDGLKIHTTLDSKLQSIAEKAVMRSVKEDQVRLNNRLYSENSREEFEKLAYLTIHSEDTLKMMLNGELELYKELRDKLFFLLYSI